jgi:tetratricopeptide (TPR) repeat protein
MLLAALPTLMKSHAESPQTQDSVSFIAAEAELFRKRGEYAIANRMFEKAIDHLKAMGDKRSSFYQELIGNFATSLYQEGQFADSEAFLTEAIDLQKKDIATAKVALANRLNTLASVLQKTRRFKDADERYSEALSLVPGDDDAERIVRASILANIGASRIVSTPGEGIC